MSSTLSETAAAAAQRERRSWTVEEDDLLKTAVEREDPGNPSPSRWFAIAKHVPGRTNKDCRKRWFAKMASDVTKGGWAPDEDERLVKAIQQVGTRWSVVASYVGTRNSDQCAKRWTDTLNPAIDRRNWTPEGDAMLLRAVEEHGKLWTKIVKLYFPGRTGLSAKNRYNSITRMNSEAARSVRGVATSQHPPLAIPQTQMYQPLPAPSTSSATPPTPALNGLPPSLQNMPYPQSSIVMSYQGATPAMFLSSPQDRQHPQLPVPTQIGNPP